MSEALSEMAELNEALADRYRAALEQIAALDYSRAAINMCALHAYEIARAALSPTAEHAERGG